MQASHTPQVRSARATWVLLIYFGVALRSLAIAQPAALPKDQDDYVAAAIKEWNIPGVALAIVKDGKPIVVKGYGVTKLGTSDAVNPDTMFDIASLTKSFTAAAIATLVDEGKLDWDTPVREYLPIVQFSDPYLTSNVTLRDLLSHRTGLRNNAAPFRGHLTRAQVVALFKHLSTSEPFRARWVYSNIGYALAGEVAAAATGSTWEKLVTSRIIEPLGLKRTTAYFDTLTTMGNYAAGHVVVDGSQRAVPRGSERLSTAAAGAVQSSARDLANWMLFQLGDGTFNGKRLISADAMAEMHGPQVYVPTKLAFRTSRQLQRSAAYGFGWQVWDYRGHHMLWHTGNGDGQVASMVLLPDSNLGIAIVTNTWRTGVQLNFALTNRLIDHYLGLQTRDYVAEFRTSWQQSEKDDAAEETALDAGRLKHAAPHVPLSAYAGQYRDPLGLDVIVVLEQDGLKLRYAGGAPASLKHWHGDTFRLSWANPFSQGRPAFVTFGLDAKGNVNRLSAELLRDQIDAARVTQPGPSKTVR
jgi:CubicO group peptidase (beta-lactamase class C family)